MMARRGKLRVWHPGGFRALLGLLILGLAATGADPGTRPAPPQVGGLSGKLLVATEELRDPRFARSVVYLVEHGAQGAMGLIVNRPIGEGPLSDLLTQFGLKGEGVTQKIRIHYGGPVEGQRGFVLHTADYVGDGTHVVAGGIALTVQPGILEAIGAGTGPRRSLFALGYSGWAPGQLEAELAAGAWVVVPADQALVFDEDHAKKWERAMARRTITL